MRITESQLRRIVRQEILREGGDAPEVIAQKLLAYLETPEGRREAELADRIAASLTAGGVRESMSRADSNFAAVGPAIGGAIIAALAMHAGVTVGAKADVMAALVGIPVGAGVGAMMAFLRSKIKPGSSL